MSCTYAASMKQLLVFQLQCKQICRSGTPREALTYRFNVPHKKERTHDNVAAVYFLKIEDVVGPSFGSCSVLGRLSLSVQTSITSFQRVIVRVVHETLLSTPEDCENVSAGPAALGRLVYRSARLSVRFSYMPCLKVLQGPAGSLQSG
jgi:hypothetical protein